MAQRKNSGGNNRNNNRGNRPPRDNQSRGPREENGSKDNKENAGKKATSAPSSTNDLLWFTLVLFVIAGAFLANRFYFAPKRPGIYNPNYKSPPFRKEGQLTFIDAQSKNSIVTIDIEIAKTPARQEMGLKNRRFLPANGGMLFTYLKPEPRTETMENIFLSLDVLFIDTELEVVRMVEQAAPLSAASMPSGSKVPYVLKVQGGFCEAFGIRVGDHVSFE